MGLFGKLFDKKNCAICGGEIGLLGNRKLEDGNLCKNCAGRLSPWFSERRHSTVAQIADQLQYRQDNRRRLPTFHETRRYGYGTNRHLIIDDQQRAFVVTSSRDWMRDNPDIVDFFMVTGCRADIREGRHEVRRKGPDGREVSFQPPRYDYDYDFSILLTIQNPWFDEMRFTLASDVREDQVQLLRELILTSETIVETFTGARPSLSGRILPHAPFCRRCGAELPRAGAECRICHPPVHERPMPMGERDRQHPMMPPVMPGAPAPKPVMKPAAPARDGNAPIAAPSMRPAFMPDDGDNAPIAAPSMQPVHGSGKGDASVAAPMLQPPVRHQSGEAPIGAPSLRPMTGRGTSQDRPIAGPGEAPAFQPAPFGEDKNDNRPMPLKPEIKGHPMPGKPGPRNPRG